jgi:NitT/TauT family transport system substrate-binding protein
MTVFKEERMSKNSRKKYSRRHFMVLGGSLAASTVLTACGATSAPATSAPAVATTAPPSATTAPVAATTATRATTAASTATTAPATSATTAAATVPLKKIRYALPTTYILSYVEAYIAKEGKFWEKEGLDVELVVGSGTASSLQQVSTKTAFAARGGAITTIIARATQDVPLRSVYNIYPNIQFVIVTGDKSNIKAPSDMKGKDLGVVSRNGSTEQLLTLILANGGVKKDDWNPKVVGAATGAYAFLEKGDVAAFTATNHVAVELKYNKSPILALPMSDFLKVPSDDVIVHADSLKEDPDTIKKVIRGLQAGRKWAQDPANIDKVIEYCKAYTPDEVKNLEVAKLKVQEDIKLWTAGSNLKLGQMDIEGWTRLQDELLKNGFIPKKLEISQIIEPSYIKEIEP